MQLNLFDWVGRAVVWTTSEILHRPRLWGRLSGQAFPPWQQIPQSARIPTVPAIGTMAKGKNQAASKAGKSAKLAAKQAKKPAALSKSAKPAAKQAKKPAALGKSAKPAAKQAKKPAALSKSAKPAAKPAKKPEAARKKVAKPKKVVRLPHLDEKTLKQIVAKLEDLRSESAHVVNTHMQEDLKQREESGDVGDDMDQAASERDREFSLIIHQRHLRRLKQIDEAFERIEDGSYGLCEGTEEPIDPKRLMIMPLARFSIEYQQQQEKMLGRSPDDSLGGGDDMMITDE